MQKKGFLLVAILVLFMAGCSLPPFNTKAKLDYDLSEVTTEYSALTADSIDSFIMNIPINDENAVGANLVEAIVSINGGKNEVVKIIENNVSGNTISQIKINPFLDTNGKLINAFTSLGDTNSIKIVKLTFKDINENSIVLGEMYNGITVSKAVTTTTSGGTVNNIPVSPTSLSYTVSSDSTKVTLNWLDNGNSLENDILGYKVYREESSDGVYVPGKETALLASSNAIVTTYSAQYIDSSVIAGKAYIYLVTAVDRASQESQKSKILYVAIYKPGNYKVTSLMGVPVSGTKNIKLSWTKPVDSTESTTAKIQGYKIYRKDNSSAYTLISDIKKPDTSEFIDYDKTLLENKDYTYEVITYDEIGQEGEAIETTPIKVKDITAPLAPSGLVLTLKPAYKLDMSWSKNSDLDLKDYTLEYTDSIKNTTWSSITVSGITNTEITLDPSEVGKTIYVRMRATDTSGNISDYSGVASKIIDYSTYIPAPTNIVLSGGPKNVTLTWDKVVTTAGYDVIGYKIKYGIDPSTLSETPIETFSNNTNVTTTSAGIWYFSIAAVEKGDGKNTVDGAYSKIQDVVVYDSLPFLRDVSADLSPKGVMVKWKDIYDSQTTGYVIYRAVTTSGATPTESDFSYLESKLKGDFEIQPAFDGGSYSWKVYQDESANEIGKTYWYKIALYSGSYDLNNPKTGKFSQAVSVEDKGAPNPVVYSTLNVLAMEPQHKIRISWGGYVFDRDDLAGFKVYISRTGEGTYYYAGKASNSYIDLDVKKDGDFDTIKSTYPLEMQDAIWKKIGTTIGSGITIAKGRTTISAIEIDGFDITKTPVKKDDYLKIKEHYYKVTGIDSSNNIGVTPNIIDNVSAKEDIYMYQGDTGAIAETRTVSLKDPMGTRMFYIKVDAYNKAGRESALTGYKWIDMVPPKTENLNVMASKYTDDSGKEVAKIEWSNNIDATKFQVYRFVGQSTLTTIDLSVEGLPITGVLLGETSNYKYDDITFNDIASTTNVVYAVVPVDAYGNKGSLYKLDSNYDVISNTTSNIIGASYSSLTR